MHHQKIFTQWITYATVERSGPQSPQLNGPTLYIMCICVHGEVDSQVVRALGSGAVEMNSSWVGVLLQGVLPVNNPQVYLTP